MYGGRQVPFFQFPLRASVFQFPISNLHFHSYIFVFHERPPPCGATARSEMGLSGSVGLRMIVLVSLIVLLRGLPCFHDFRMVHPIPTSPFIQ